MENLIFFLFSWSLCLGIFFQMILGIEVRSKLILVTLLLIFPKIIKNLKKKIVYKRLIMLCPVIIFIINQILFYFLDKEVKKVILLIFSYSIIFIFLDIKKVNFKNYIKISKKIANCLLVIFIFFKFYIGNMPYFNHMIIGNFLSFLSIIYFIYFLIYKKIEICWIINIGLILLYAHRGALIPLIFMVIYILNKKIREKRKFKQIFILILFLISCGTIFLILKKEIIYFIKEDLEIKSRLIDKLYFSYQNVKEWGGFFSGREELYYKTLELILKKPLGGGIFYHYNEFNFFYSHLIFLDFILNFGILFIIIILVSLIKIRKILKREDELKIMMIFILLNMSNYIFSYYYIFLPYFWIFYSILSTNIVVEERKNLENKKVKEEYE